MYTKENYDKFIKDFAVRTKGKQGNDFAKELRNFTLDYELLTLFIYNKENAHVIFLTDSLVNLTGIVFVEYFDGYSFALVEHLDSCNMKILFETLEQDLEQLKNKKKNSNYTSERFFQELERRFYKK